MCGLISTEAPHITPANFEKSLATDHMLAHFFNRFLSLPCFSECVLYNQGTGLFEVDSGAAQSVSSTIRSLLHCSKSQLLVGDPTALARSPPVDPRYAVCCLDGEQGIQWIIKERLPLFLRSDCYSEYRLAKLFEWELNLCIQRRRSLGRANLSAPQLHSSSQFGKENQALNTQSCSHSPKSSSAKQEPMMMPVTSGKEEQPDTKHSHQRRCFSSLSEPELPCTSPPLSSSPSSSKLTCEKSQQPQVSQTAPSSGSTKGQHFRPGSQSSELQLEHFAAQVVKQVLNNALNVMDDRSHGNSECLSESGDQTDCSSSTDRSWGCKASRHLADGSGERLKGKEEKVQEGFKNNREEGGEGADRGNVLNMGCHGSCCPGSRAGLGEFREFLRGTPGEKLLNLWMDIERLKATQSREQKNRYLALMRSWYLHSSSPSKLHTELLSRLQLSTSPCWTEENLRSAQPLLTESLLLYWAPRFWTSRRAEGGCRDSPDPGVWTEWCGGPLPGSQSHHDSVSLPSLRPDSGLPQSPHAAHAQLHWDGDLGSRRMEKMLQALCVESCSGFYLTDFCEQSGNQLWQNAVHFWTELQHYRELFYQEGLDPYRVQREAQLLHSTYVFSCARRSVGVDEEVRREVYDRMTPAYEELFDRVEEHVLEILVQPWTLLLCRDRESLQKVCVREEVRSVDSREYRELQSLYEESERRLRQVEPSVLFSSSRTPPAPLCEGPRASEAWSRVAETYRGYRLGSLLRHRHEIRHFMSFLQARDASIHLAAWLDLQQYRRTPQRDQAVRQERASHIASKYLDRKYFFGPDSPATTHQQNTILRLAGGLERLRLECFSDTVAAEIQEIIRSHIEEKWLPLFLSTAEFTERQKHQPKPQAADGLSRHVSRRRRARREAWKAEGLWMSSSKEILVFRRILLNPATCSRFQHFVSLKGDFLENDMLFWLEVQRYKDLCHSHSDEATVQQKISTIINCFINSSVPPALQIDIPEHQAQHILDKRHELGPYIFREAQMSVFSGLLKFWPEFQELCSSVREEQLLPLLQEKRVKHRAKVRRQRRKEEEEEEEEEEQRRAQDAPERPESCFGEKEETNDEDEEEEEGEGGKREQKPSRTPSRVLLASTQPLSWSYSKYMAALKKEEALLRRQKQPEATFSTASDSSSDCSVKSAGSRLSQQPPSHHSSRAERKQCSRQHRGGRGCNMK